MIHDKHIIDNVIQMAHDIRSPLLALQVVLESPGKFSDKKRGLLLRTAQRLQEIADSILEHHRNSARETDLKALIQDILDEKRLVYKNDFFTLKTEENRSFLKDLNPIEMKRMISNLINNSIEATKNRPAKVELSLTQWGERIQITVKDHGKKIPPIYLAKIFERGVTFGKKKGSGTGLTHAKNYIESIGGSINISSDQMETIVSIYL